MEHIRTTIYLPIKRHQALRRLSLERRTSMAQLILKALDAIFLAKPTTGARSLWGAVRNSRIKDEDFPSLKTKV